ncbi:MAG: hypothetical protein COB35_11695 [Gammaproteobacteria bacterium]|nr:MAG: hypothetical protein COB35_11695 [Gammaproteobacteria bacterium]
MILVYKKQQGFTLIELLVVMTISGILLAFVGPVAMEQIDSSKAKSEIEKLKGIIRYASVEAYTQGKSITVELQNNQVFKSHNSKKKIIFSYITFSNQRIVFNRNGFSNQVEVLYSYHDQLKRIDVYALLGYGEDDFIYVP